MEERKAAEIGRRVRERREQLGLSLADLSARTGLSRSYYSRLEAGGTLNPKIFDLAATAEALGLSLVELLGEDRAAIEAATDRLTDDSELKFALVELVSKLEDRTPAQRRFLLAAIQAILRVDPDLGR